MMIPSTGPTEIPFNGGSRATRAALRTLVVEKVVDLTVARELIAAIRGVPAAKPT